LGSSFGVFLVSSTGDSVFSVFSTNGTNLPPPILALRVPPIPPPATDAPCGPLFKFFLLFL